jgi:MFS family permease
MAGQLSVLPYFMSMGLSPILGLVIDKVGRRALFIMISSIIAAGSCIYTAFMPTAEPGSQDWTVLIPLIALGFGYSIYAAALWGSIPYVVEPKTIGSAFGLTTSLQ